MHREIVETQDGWLVFCENHEVARFHSQGAALTDVARRLSVAEASVSCSLTIQYLARVA